MIKNLLEDNFYVPPTDFSINKVRKLHLNENLYGPPPPCLNFLKNSSLDLILEYPKRGNQFIVDSIADYCHLDKNQIFVNQGAADILFQIFQFVLRKGSSRIVLPSPHWSYYSSLASLYNAKIYYSKLVETKTGFKYTAESILKLSDPSYKLDLIVINSPHMPTGCKISYNEISRISKVFPETLIILDEAYLGFDFEIKTDLKLFLEEHPNIIIVRTFSKLFALAGCRVGFGLSSSKFIPEIQKLGPLFGINRLSQELACIALKNNDYYKDIAKRIIASRNFLIKEINDKTKFLCYDSSSNFVLVNTLETDPEDVVRTFEKHGCIIRNCKGYDLKSHLRISVGKEKDVNFVIKYLIAFGAKIIKK